VRPAGRAALPVKRSWRDRARESGQSLVEFSIAIPIFLVLVLGMVDLGHVVWANASLANATREGARYAIVRGGSYSSRCPVGPPATTAVVPAASAACPYPSPSKQGIVSAVVTNAVAAGNGVTVSVCYGTDCTGDSDMTGATNERGTPVTVRATSSVPLVIGSLLGMSGFTISSQTTMIVSH
jgi:Flp pilus assembly protein TadG